MARTSYDDRIKAQTEERLNGAISAWNRGDLDGYMEVYLKSDFATLIPDADHVWGVGKIRQHYEKQIGKSGKLSFHIVEIILLGINVGGEYAFVSGHFTVEGAGHPEREVNGNFTLLMMRLTNEIGGLWYVFKDHSA